MIAYQIFVDGEVFQAFSLVIHQNLLVLISFVMRVNLC